MFQTHNQQIKVYELFLNNPLTISVVLRVLETVKAHPTSSVAFHRGTHGMNSSCVQFARAILIASI